MRHARPAALDRIEPLLEALRELPALTEKSRGVFYRGSKAFLHFHEHGIGEIYADVRLGGADFDRFAVTDEDGCKALLRRVVEALGDGKPPNAR